MASAAPVREAILKLADEGLLEIFPQSGIFVSRIPIAELPEAILVRRALEETTARIAASQATASRLLALQSVLQSQREAESADDHDAFHRADEAFHATIAEVAGYPGIWTLIQQVKIHVDRYRRLTLPQPGRITRAIAEHETILAAIAAHDPAQAVAAIGDSSGAAARGYIGHPGTQSGLVRNRGVQSRRRPARHGSTKTTRPQAGPGLNGR